MSETWGLWSLAREAWHPDPMHDGVLLRFDNVMDAIRVAATYSVHFRLVPIRFAADGTPDEGDLQNMKS